MTTIVSTLNRVARECSLDVPDNWITTDDDSYVEIRDDFLLEVIDDLLRRVEWADPIGKIAQISGSGAEDYALPSDFYRKKNSVAAIYETASVRRVGVEVTSDGAWTHLKELGTGAGSRYYRLNGYEGNWEISLYPNPAAGESVTVHYVSNVWLVSSGGTEGSEFTATDDILLFPRTLVESGIIWRWRRRKGLTYQDRQAEYEQIIAQLSNRTNVRRSVNMGEAQPVDPWAIPIPDFIPDS